MAVRLICVILAVVLSSSAAFARTRPRVISFIGDSTTGALYSPPGYPKLVGDMLHLRVHNLATKYPPSYSTRQALDEELPNLPADTTECVVFLGVDDLRALAKGDTSLADVQDANAKLLAALQSRRIRVYEITIRDYTRDRLWAPQPYDVESMHRIPQFVEALNTYYKSTPNVTIIDGASWEDVYVGKWSPDGIHFYPPGLKLFARHVADAIR